MGRRRQELLAVGAGQVGNRTQMWTAVILGTSSAIDCRILSAPVERTLVGALEGCPDESTLGLGIGVAVVSVLLGKPTLQRRVATCDLRVGSESVTEVQLVAISL